MNTWRVVYRYSNWKGERKQTQKRGFLTKKEALAWEREQLQKVKADLDMTFESFVSVYTEDMQNRMKENTWATKEHIIRCLDMLEAVGEVYPEAKYQRCVVHF